MKAENKTSIGEEITLPPMKFVCELPKSTNPVMPTSWSDTSMELIHLGPIIDKYLQNNPFEFQAEAIPKIILGKDLLLTAGTGSGKTEIFLFAILELLLQEKITKAIIFYPSKQLIQNQEARLRTFLSWIQKELGKKITYSSYTGDLSSNAIAGIERARPEILLATFDKVFHRIVRDQKSAADILEMTTTTAANQRFFEHLASAGVIVFDEIHVYSGLLLSNVHNYLMVHHTVNPTCRFILSSATIAEAESFRNDFIPQAEIISGKPHRGPIQVLTMDRKYLEPFNKYIQNKLLRNRGSSEKNRRVILFNDSISENEALTYTIKQQLSDATGLELQQITDLNQNSIACIHSQLPPERKQVIVQKAEENQLKYLISTDLLAQGLNFPDFYMGVQIGWPITGLTGAVQRIGRIRFTGNLDEIRYFVFVFDTENEQEGYLFAQPKVLAKKLLEKKLPPLIFSRENFRIIQGFLFLAVSYEITSISKLEDLYCRAIFNEATKLETEKKIRQVLTYLMSLGILAITDDEISIGSYTELALFLRDYSLRAIPPKWSVKNLQTKKELFVFDSRKVLREALPGNVLLNDGLFWLVKNTLPRQKEIFVEELTHQQKPDLAKLKKNKCFSPAFSFKRFTKKVQYKFLSVEYGDLQIIRKPATVYSYASVLGHTTIDLSQDTKHK